MSNVGMSPFQVPSIQLRICFSGHRLQHLEDNGSDLVMLGTKCRDALRLVTSSYKRAVEESDSHSKFMDLSPRKLRFCASLANGADMLAVEAAVAEECDMHFFLPFAAGEFVKRQQFTDEETSAFKRIWEVDDNSPESIRSATRTEIDLGQNHLGLSPYASCGRLMLDHADALIAIWDGKTDNGPGGTRDVMRDAQRRGLTVVRITLTGSIGVWVPSEDAVDPSIDGCFSDECDRRKDEQEDAAKVIQDNLGSMLFPPRQSKILEQAAEANSHVSAGPLKWVWRLFDWFALMVTNLVYGRHAVGLDPAERLDVFMDEKPRTSTLSSGFYALQAAFGVRSAFWPVLSLTETTDSSWDNLAKTANDVGGEAYSERINATVFKLWQRTDSLAVYFSHVFRTAYILNFLLSVIAVAAGLLIVFQADKSAVYDSKGILVSLELGVIFFILMLVYLGARLRWKDRWIDYRNIAEVLRTTRLPLLIGSVPSHSGGAPVRASENSWIAWYIRSHLRQIPPPNGQLNPDTLNSAIEFAVTHELEGQIQYHRSNANRLNTLDHRMHILATSLLLGTIGIGIAYLTMLFFDVSELYKAMKPYVTFFGGILPVCGAAINGIRATGDFRAAADQSSRVADLLIDIQSRLVAEMDCGEPRRFHVRSLLNEATRIMTDDLDVWSMIYSQRDLGPGVG